MTLTKIIKFEDHLKARGMVTSSRVKWAEDRILNLVGE